MNISKSTQVVNITVGKSAVSYQMLGSPTQKQVCTGLKNLQYPQFAAEFAADHVIKEIGALENNTKLVKVDNSHWKLLINTGDSKSAFDGNLFANFKIFESMCYDFYRFSSLVKDMLIHPQKISIPYDIEMKIVYESYMRVPELGENETPYDQHVAHIENDQLLNEQLIRSNENKKLN